MSKLHCAGIVLCIPERPAGAVRRGSDRRDDGPTNEGGPNLGQVSPAIRPDFQDVGACGRNGRKGCKRLIYDLSSWRRGPESNRCIKVLQTSALPTWLPRPLGRSLLETYRAMRPKVNDQVGL